MSVQDIVRIRRYAALGDIILTTPFIRELKKYYKVDVSTSNSKIISELVDSFRNEDRPDAGTVVDLDLAYEKRPTMHVLDAYAEVVRSHGLPVPDLKQTGPMVNSAEIPENINQYLKNHKYVVFHLGGYGWPAKKIKTDFWCELASNLIKFHSLKPVIVGTSCDQTLRNSFRAIDLRLKLTVPEVRAVISKAVMFIGADSAPYHIASCTNTPQVGLFTVVNGHFFKPLHKDSLVINTPLDCGNCLRRLPAPRTTHYCVKEVPNVCTSSFSADDVYHQILRHPSTALPLQRL